MCRRKSAKSGRGDQCERKRREGRFRVHTLLRAHTVRFREKRRIKKKEGFFPLCLSFKGTSVAPRSVWRISRACGCTTFQTAKSESKEAAGGRGGFDEQRPNRPRNSKLEQPALHRSRFDTRARGRSRVNDVAQDAERSAGARGQISGGFLNIYCLPFYRPYVDRRSRLLSICYARPISRVT